MMPVYLLPENTLMAKIYTKGKCLPLKMKFRKLEPQVFVFVGLNFMPDPNLYSYKYFGEDSIYVREEAGSFSGGYIGFCIATIEPLSTLIGCAFAANAVRSLKSLRNSTGSLPKLKPNDEVAKVSFQEFVDLRLEISDSKPLVTRDQDH